MKKLLLIIPTLLTLPAKSQTSVYHVFPDSNAVWTIQAQGCCANNCPPPPNPNPVLDDYNFSYFLQGDTIISSTSYHKLYQSGNIHSHCAIGNYIDYWTTISKTYVGAYRQDTVLKQVFFYYPSTNMECLLYDFSLNVGDSVAGGCFGFNSCTNVSSIDSVLIGNNYRKRFNLSTMNYSLIEGIGSTSGLLEPLCPFEYFGTLICFAQNGQTLFPDTITSCEIFTPVNEIKHSRSFSISPNPFHIYTTLQLNSEFLNSELIIYNTLGNKVRHQIIYDKTILIYRNELCSGIYFFNIINEKGQTANGKIIIE